MDLHEVFKNLFEQARASGQPAQKVLSRGLALRARVKGQEVQLTLFRKGTVPSDDEVRTCIVHAELKQARVNEAKVRDGWGEVCILGSLKALDGPEPEVNRDALIREILQAMQDADPYWKFETAVSNRMLFLRDLKPTALLAEHRQFVRKPCQSTTT